MAVKLNRLTHKIAIQLHLVEESCTICSSRSRRPVRNLLDTSSYIHAPYLPTYIQTYSHIHTHFIRIRFVHMHLLNTKTHVGIQFLKLFIINVHFFHKNTQQFETRATIECAVCEVKGGATECENISSLQPTSYSFCSSTPSPRAMKPIFSLMCS
jgi:hypothetical protein